MDLLDEVVGAQLEDLEAAPSPSPDELAGLDLLDAMVDQQLNALGEVLEDGELGDEELHASALEEIDNYIDEAALPFSDEEIPPESGDEADDAAPVPAGGRAAIEGGGAIVTSYADRSVRQPRIERARAYQHLEELERAVAAAEVAEAAAQRAEVDAKARVSQLAQEREAQRALFRRAEAEGARDPNLAQQHALQRTVAAVTEEHRLQEEAVVERTAAARAAELATDKLRLEAKRTAEQLAALKTAEPVEKAMFEDATARRIARERRAAEKQVESIAASREAAAHAVEVRKARAEEQLRAAREGHTRAVSRLRETVRQNRARLPEVNSQMTERYEKRAERVIALKASTEAAAAELRSSNEQKEERRQRVLRQREEEKVAILAKGGNPYAVFRKRDEDARLARAQAELKETLASNMEQLQAGCARLTRSSQ